MFFAKTIRRCVFVLVCFVGSVSCAQQQGAEVSTSSAETKVEVQQADAQQAKGVGIVTEKPSEGRFVDWVPKMAKTTPSQSFRLRSSHFG